MLVYVFVVNKKEYMIDIFNYPRRYDAQKSRLILEDDLYKSCVTETPNELMERQLNTYEQFNNISTRRFDAVDKYNKSRLLGENKLLKNKTLWELYDIGCDDGINFNSGKLLKKCDDSKECIPSNATLFDDYEIRRYPTPENKYGKWIGLEMTATDYNYVKNDNPEKNCYDTTILNNELDIESNNRGFSNY